MPPFLYPVFQGFTQQALIDTMLPMAEKLTDADFKLFSSLVYDESGIMFSDSNRTILESRLYDCVREKHAASLSDYYTLITSKKDELDFFLDQITTNLTYFFRNQQQFDTLAFYVIPSLLEYKKKLSDTHIRIWSAGCSTGEEAYTIAMILEECLPPPYTYQITASDLSLRSLMVGRSGFYLENKVEGIPEKYLNRYFTKKDTGYQILPSLMQKIKFDYHNLKYDSGMRNLDVIFCRNVLIYFDDEAQKTVIDHFWNDMSPQSYLFIGHSESLFGTKTQFKFLKTKWGHLYQKNIE